MAASARKKIQSFVECFHIRAVEAVVAFLGGQETLGAGVANHHLVVPCAAAVAPIEIDIGHERGLVGAGERDLVEVQPGLGWGKCRVVFG